MNEEQQELPEGTGGRAYAGRLAYVIPADAVHIENSDKVDLLHLWRVLRSNKWPIFSFAAIMVVVGVLYALFATRWYRAEVLLLPADATYAEGAFDQFGGFGGLAGLAGINLGRTDTAEPLAVLTSREFTRSFILEHQLLPVLFAEEWDAKLQRWKAMNQRDQPDQYDAVKFFDEEILRVRDNQKSGLITLAIEWTDPTLASAWANALIKRLNDRMRSRSLQEAEARIRFLTKELEATNVVTLQETIGRLLESELQKAMMARSVEEFAFRVIDRAEEPKWHSRPNRALIIGFSLIVGLLLPALAVVMRNSMLENRQSRAGGARLHHP